MALAGRKFVVRSNEGKPVWLGKRVGTLARIWGEDTGGFFAALELTITPGSIVIRHVHSREDESTYVIEGEIGARIGDQIVKAPAGSHVIKPRGIPHTFWNAGRKDARTLEIISPPGFAKYFQELSGILDGPITS